MVKDLMVFKPKWGRGILVVKKVKVGQYGVLCKARELCFHPYMQSYVRT